MTPEPLLFDCGTERLLGLLHHSASPSEIALLIVVGGPQYRVGSHRQFLLLARRLAAAGTPVLRFDYRGMGDSEGGGRDFEAVTEDLRAAIDALCRRLPEVTEVVIWGLCDGASAACMYAAEDSRVSGLVLLNPWVRTEQGEARAYLKHYYLQRLVNPDLWRKIMSGRFDLLAALRDLAAKLKGASNATRSPSASADRESMAIQRAAEPQSRAAQQALSTPLPDRMLAGLRRFRGGILLILSGNDLTAAEFRELVAGSPSWRRVLQTHQRRELPEADHTFSRECWRQEVEMITLEWIKRG